MMLSLAQPEVLYLLPLAFLPFLSTVFGTAGVSIDRCHRSGQYIAGIEGGLKFLGATAMLRRSSERADFTGKTMRSSGPAWGPTLFF